MINNGVELKSMTYNGQEVKTWVHNGVEVWASAVPFYWVKGGVVQSGMPTKWNVSRMEPMNSSWASSGENSVSRLAACAPNTSNLILQLSTDAIPTQGNKYMEITMYSAGIITSASGNGGQLINFTAGGVDVTSQVKGGAVIKVDVSSKTSVNLYVDMRAWAWNWVYFYIEQIRFYS